MMYSRKHPRSTINEVLAFREIQLLILVGSMRFACKSMQWFLVPSLVENLTKATDFHYFFVVLYSGTAFANIISTLVFQAVFKRNFAITLTLMQALSTVVSAYILSIGFALPQIKLESGSMTFAYIFVAGFLEGSIQLFIQIIGPLLVAASNRKTYEITLGGTMIAMCRGLPYVIGTIIATICVEIELIHGEARLLGGLLIMVLSFTSILPFLVSALTDVRSRWFTSSEQRQSKQEEVEIIDEYVPYHSPVNDSIENRKTVTIALG